MKNCFINKAREVYEKHGEEAARKFILQYKKNELGTVNSTLKTIDDASDGLYRVTKSAPEATQTVLRQNYENATKSGLTPKVEEAILDKFGKGKDVSPAEEQIISKFFTPLKKKINSLYSEAKDLNPELASKFEEEFGLNRLATHTGKWKDFFEGIWGGDLGGFGTYGAKPSAMKQRTVFKMGDTIITRSGDTIIAWKNGKMTPLGTTRTALKAGDEFKGQKITEVLDQREIEQHVPNINYASPMFAHSVKVAELEKFVAQMKFLEELKNSELGSQMMRREGEFVPEGYRKLTNADKIPQLRNYYMEPRLAEVLEDYLRPGESAGGINKTLEAVNGFSVKLFMLNPIPHIGNELAHYFTGRGLFAGWLTPKGLQGVANIPDAFRSVMTQDKLQVEIARNGGSLMSMSIRNNNWMKRVMESQIKQADKATGFVGKVADMLGWTAEQTIGRLSKASNMIMWTTRDAMYTSMIMERMNQYGENIQQAIKHVDKFMPSYRIPSRVGMDNSAGRFLSNVMQNKAATVFSRYHYGMVRAIKESFKDLGIKGKRAEGMDHLAAYAAGMAIVYPFLDYMYRSVFGEDVRQRRQGGFHLIDSIMKASEGEKTPETVVASLVTPSPVLTMAAAAWSNKDPFTGKAIRIPEDTLFGQAWDAAKYFGSRAAPLAGVSSVLAGGKSEREWAMQQMDIEVEDRQKKLNKEKARQRRMSEAKKRQKERGF